MCGIAGFISTAGRCDPDALHAVAERQADSMRHRGPDSGDVYVDSEAGVALAHRRLAIVDLSAAGHQPMSSGCGRYAIAYNGEIYNAGELRDALTPAGRRFRGHSDTEALLEACVEWGVEVSVRRSIGMFAFALWDRETRTLTLARDRLGIKPLYYAHTPGLFLFGSELKALRAHPGFDRTVDRDSVASYLRYLYVPAPNTVYKAVRKLEPGSILTIRADGGEVEAPKRFWSLRDVAATGLERPAIGNDAELTDGLDALLLDAVGRRMVADVPLGVFLSGGIDSSVVAALMQEQSADPVRSFSIGFEQGAYDEAVHAAQVARHLGTDHTELYVTAQQARDVIPALPAMFDEPFSDSSQIPTYLVAAMTRQHVTVALSGDGGDELFAGYTRYVHAQRIAGGLRRVPTAARRLLSRALQAMPLRAWDALFSVVPEARRPMYAGDKVHKFARALGYDENGFFRRLVSMWDEPDSVSLGGHERATALDDPDIVKAFPDFLDRMQYLDSVTYLPDDILTKVDRTSMAVSLEVRVPLLDHRVVEYAWHLPQDVKIRDGRSKWILRQVLYRRVPPALIDRPKMGFAIPLDAWLRGALRSWAEDLLSPAALQRHGLVRCEPVRQAWAEHLSGKRNWSAPLWNVLMLQSWCEEFL